MTLQAVDVHAAKGTPSAVYSATWCCSVLYSAVSRSHGAVQPRAAGAGVRVDAAVEAGWRLRSSIAHRPLNDTDWVEQPRTRVGIDSNSHGLAKNRRHLRPSDAALRCLPKSTKRPFVALSCCSNVSVTVYFMKLASHRAGPSRSQQKKRQRQPDVGIAAISHGQGRAAVRHASPPRLELEQFVSAECHRFDLEGSGLPIRKQLERGRCLLSRTWVLACCRAPHGSLLSEMLARPTPHSVLGCSSAR